MKIYELSYSSTIEAARVLKEGGIVCFPTDTIYGLLALATDKNVVERLFSIRRPSNRPFLILIPSLRWVRRLGLRANIVHYMLMEKFNATFIFYKKTPIPLFLTRGRKSLAIRLPPYNSHVSKLLSLVDLPLVAPSANPEGEKPASSIKEAVEYFGDKIDLYVDGGTIEAKPSTIVRALYPKGLRLIRDGNIPFDKILNFYRTVITSSSLTATFPSESSS
ncbi:MAG: L-threonylcarbamoyladenylate synthase [Aquificaceae bacterium]